MTWTALRQKIFCKRKGRPKVNILAVVIQFIDD